MLNYEQNKKGEKKMNFLNDSREDKEDNDKKFVRVSKNEVYNNNGKGDQRENFLQEASKAVMYPDEEVPPKNQSFLKKLFFAPGKILGI